MKKSASVSTNPLVSKFHTSTHINISVKLIFFLFKEKLTALMHREREMAKLREALVVCSDSSKGGMKIWDIDTGEELLYIPTCAAVPNGLLCLRDQFLVASQIHKHGSVGGGSIAFWNFNKVLHSSFSAHFSVR